MDGNPPESHSQETLAGPSLPLGNQTFFTSAVLPFAEHVVDVNVTQTGQGRNFTFDYFEVITPSSTTTPSVIATPGTKKNVANVGAIAGGVIGGIAFLSMLLLAFIFFWKRGPRVLLGKPKLPMYRQSMKAASTGNSHLRSPMSAMEVNFRMPIDAIQPFIRPSTPDGTRYRSDPKLTPQTRLNDTETLTFRGRPSISSVGVTYAETASPTISPDTESRDPQTGENPDTLKRR